MIAGRLRIPRGRWLVTMAVVFTGLTLLTFGCGGLDVDSYPEDFEYPARTSPLIISKENKGLKPTVDSFVPLGTMPQEQLHQIALNADKLVRDVSKINADQRHRLQVALRGLFGTPAKPLVIPYFNATDGQPSRAGTDGGKTSTQVLVKLFATDDNHLADYNSESAATRDERRVWAKVEREILPNGSKLYRRHCLHCHGVPGNGRGPTAPWVKPHPRDYRKGELKFVSSSDGKKPLRSDLYRTLHDGLDGTAMPPFKHLTSQEINELVSYVIHLSMRGEVEYFVLNLLLDEPEADVNREVASALKAAVDGWTMATALPVFPYEETKVGKAIAAAKTDKEMTLAMEASVGRGYQLFVNNPCMQCHENFGRVDSYRLDTWGTMVRPRDLTKGVLRGGRRPVDLYYRIMGGIDAAQMPKFTPQNADDAWDLVNFVRALPYKHMLPEDVRERIYPAAKSGN